MDINTYIAIVTVIGFPIFGFVYSLFNKITNNRFIPNKFNHKSYDYNHEENKNDEIIVI